LALNKLKSRKFCGKFADEFNKRITDLNKDKLQNKSYFEIANKIFCFYASRKNSKFNLIGK
jgi:hypothetical protein